MPSARVVAAAAVGGQQEQKTPRSRKRVVRTDSLRSERSDKRVSFNKDVGVKHIPRGQQQSQPQRSRTRVLLNGPKDEWARSVPVNRQPVNLSSEELERHAEDLVQQLSKVTCSTSDVPHFTRSLDRPPKKKNNSIPNNRHTLANNTAAINNANVNNTLIPNGYNNVTGNNINASPKPLNEHTRKLPTTRTANPISKRQKDDVNLGDRQQASKNTNQEEGLLQYKSSELLPIVPPYVIDERSEAHKSVGDLPSVSLYILDPYQERRDKLFGYKSVPDIPSTTNTVVYDNQEARSYKHRNTVANSRSAERINNDSDAFIKPSLSRDERKPIKSADNLLEEKNQNPNRLANHKSVGHLPSAISNHIPLSEDSDMADQYRPRVGRIINRLEAEAEERRVRHHILEDEEEMDIPMRGAVVEPNKKLNHNNNKPFSYTGVITTSGQPTKRISPPRHISPGPSRTEDWKRPNEGPVYAQVNKGDRRSPQRDYSAKIIITDNNDRLASDSAHTYEDYQMTQNNFRRVNNYKNEYDDYDRREDMLHKKMQGLDIGVHDNDLLDEYKSHSNNNINMSSIGVQTDNMPKPPARGRKGQQLQQHQRQSHLQQQRELHLQQQRRLAGQSQTVYKNESDLSSAHLVRQVNHGFGRTDRSPSPPQRRRAPKPPRQSVVPLLSDTSDDDGHRRQAYRSPMDKIRDQVGLHESSPPRHMRSYDRDEVVPIQPGNRYSPVREEVDHTSRGEYMMQKESSANRTTRVTSNERNRHTEQIIESRHPTTRRVPRPHRDNKNNEARNRSASREKIQEERVDNRTLERNRKNNLEKEKAAKEKKEKDGKEKKKRKMKINFFYDPRPQDDHNADPLAKFQEYKGTSSDERPSPRDHHRGNKSRHDRADSSSRERPSSRDHRPSPRESPERRESSRDYSSSRSRDRLDRRESFKEPPKPPRRGSRENVESSKHRSSSHEVRETRSTSRGREQKERDYRDRDVRDRDVRERERDLRERDREREAIERERDYIERERELREMRRGSRERIDDGALEDVAEEDDDELDDGRSGRRLSDKYRSVSNYDRKSDDNMDKPPIEDDERKEKLLRQRKKFFTALVEDGRAKGSNSNSKTQSQQPPDDKKEITEGRWDPDIQEEKTESSKKVDKRTGWGESVTLDRHELRTRQQNRTSSSQQEPPQAQPRGYSTIARTSAARKSSAESSASSTAAPVPRVRKNTSFKKRYFGDTDRESMLGSEKDDYRSLPRARRPIGGQRGGRIRGASPGGLVGGSAGSSAHSSESEAGSHQGSHASRQSMASHVSTGSNRSVYLHAMAVADIPVNRGATGAPTDRSDSQRGMSTQTKKVSRSFSMLTPWKPRHYRDKFEVEYENKDERSALPPRPPRRQVERSSGSDASKKVNRSQSVYKNSRLAGWLRRRNKEAKGI